jgi:hypothetical protein
MDAGQMGILPMASASYRECYQNPPPYVHILFLNVLISSSMIDQPD